MGKRETGGQSEDSSSLEALVFFRQFNSAEHCLPNSFTPTNILEGVFLLEHLDCFQAEKIHQEFLLLHTSQASQQFYAWRQGRMHLSYCIDQPSNHHFGFLHSTSANQSPAILHSISHMPSSQLLPLFCVPPHISLCSVLQKFVKLSFSYNFCLPFSWLFYEFLA